MSEDYRVDNFYSIKGIENADINTVRDFVRDYLPHNEHFLMTPVQLRLTALKIMDRNCMLSHSDSEKLNTPLFGEAYVSSGGNLVKTLLNVGFDILPGATLVEEL